MGIKLFNPIYTSPPDSIIERSQFWGFSIGWWTQCVLQTGQLTIMREVPFGGNRGFVGINPDFWDNSSSAWLLEEMIDTLYVIGPGGGPPGPAGNVSLGWQFQPYFGVYLFNIAFQPNDGHFAVFKFPGILNSGWLPEVQPDLPSQFLSLGSDPTTVYPLPVC